MNEQKKRVVLPYENKSARYITKKEDADGFQKQFYFIYRSRIEALTPRIVASAKTIWGIRKLWQLSDVTKGGDFFVIGVILKKMKYRKSILYGFTDEETMDFDFRKKLESNNLASSEDCLELEDHQQIIKLGGNISPDQYATGQVVGIFGFQERDDLFSVKHVIFPEIAMQIPWPVFEKDCYVLFISGIQLNSDMARNEKALYALTKFSKWLSGESPISEKELEVVSNISRMVIAGESIRISDEDAERQRVDFLGTLQELDRNAITHFDKVLSLFVNNIHVDVMCGSNDPASSLMPQQPIPRIVFPVSRRFGKLLNTVSNPYKFSIGGLNFLGTAGQNIRDLTRLTIGLSELDLMEQCLERSHIFPTVPDSIDGFPLQDRDPLVLDELPHVFFAGNQERLASKMMVNPNKSKTLLINIPAFYETKTVVLLNLRTMGLREYDFSQQNDLLI